MVCVYVCIVFTYDIFSSSFWHPHRTGACARWPGWEHPKNLCYIHCSVSCRDFMDTQADAAMVQAQLASDALSPKVLTERACVCVRVYMFVWFVFDVCTYVYMYICDIYICICIYIYTYIYIYMHVYT
jgi:hypothetical protein